MTTCFDVIVVGAGPCALATLSALPANLSVAIITGSEPALPSPSDVHPKVRVVSLESGQHPGVADRIEPIEGKHRTLYATAITGGWQITGGSSSFVMGAVTLMVQTCSPIIRPILMNVRLWKPCSVLQMEPRFLARPICLKASFCMSRDF